MKMSLNLIEFASMPNVKDSINSGIVIPLNYSYSYVKLYPASVRLTVQFPTSFAIPFVPMMLFVTKNTGSIHSSD